ARLADIASEINRASGAHLSLDDVAQGFVTIAVEQMAEAIKKISIQRGHDPKHYVLCAFGGAGGQHACAVADAVGVASILIHPLAGVLSAWGMGLAELTAIRELTIEQPIDAPDIAARAEALAEEARSDLLAQGAPREAIRAAIIAHVKYAGADS